MYRRYLALCCCCVAFLTAALLAADQPEAPAIPLPEHPRPDFQRSSVDEPQWQLAIPV